MRPLLVTIFTLGISFYLVGQIRFKDQSEVYNYWAKRGIIEMIYAYMEDLDSRDINDQIGQENYKIKFIDNIDQKDKSHIDQDFNYLDQYLKENNWSRTAEQILNSLISNYKALKIIDHTFFDIDGSGKGYREKGTKCNQTQERIINKYRAAKKFLIEPFNEQAVIETLPHLEISHNDASFLKFDVSSIRRIRSIFFYVGFFLLSFLFGCIFMYYIFKKQIHFILWNEKDKYLSELHDTERYFPKWLGMVEVLKRSKDQYKIEKELVNNQDQLIINNLKQRELELIQENEALKTKRNSPTEQPQTNPTGYRIIPTSNITVKILYFSAPDENGRFKIENGKKQNDGNNFYKIEHEENKPNAILHFLPGELDQRAIELIHGYLLPVCEIENFSDRINAKRIQVLTPGKVILTNDHWAIDPHNKVKIKLI